MHLDHLARFVPILKIQLHRINGFLMDIINLGAGVDQILDVLTGRHTLYIYEKYASLLNTLEDNPERIIVVAQGSLKLLEVKTLRDSLIELRLPFFNTLGE
jgi:hypothetical protein